MPDTRSRPVRILALALVALLAMLVLSACGGEERAEGGSVFAEMLRLVPDRPRPWHAIEMGDLARYRELAGIEPGHDLDSQAYLEVLTAPAAVPFPGLGFIVHQNMPHLDRFSDNTRRALGFGVQDVDQWLRLWDPVAPQFAIRGNFDPERVDDLLAGCPECPPPQTIDHRGTAVYAWGGDDEVGAAEPLSPPIFDSIGRGCCIAVQDRYVIRAYTRTGVTSILDAQAGTGSIADDENFRLAAEGLDHMGTLDADILRGTFDRAYAERVYEEASTDGPGIGSRVREAVAIAPHTVLLVPYSTIAFGRGYTGGEPFGAVVLVHATEEAARANEERLGRRFQQALVMQPFDGPRQTWAERYDRIDIEVDGRVLRVRLGGALFDPFTAIEAAFIHE